MSSGGGLSKLAGHKLLDVASGQFWTWDSGDRVTVDQRITVVDAEGRSRSRVFMHRLLRGSVCFPDAFGQGRSLLRGDGEHRRLRREAALHLL
jgi:hypothetical protein